MATYYVRKTGLDSNDGLSAGAAFLTIDKAANTVTAPSTVYVGAGVYREQVTMDTAGTSGNLISYIADVDGEQTGDAGLVIISAYDDEASAATRASCWDPNEKEFITVQGFTMTGGTSATIFDGHANNISYEEVTFEDCVIVAGHDDPDMALFLDLNATTSVPTTAGFTIRRCVIAGAILIQYNENATSETNVKMAFESNLWIGLGDTSNSGPGLEFERSTVSTWPIGGVSITNNTFYGVGYGIYVEKPTATTFTNPIVVHNNLFMFADRDVSMSASGSEGFVDSDYNTSSHVSTNFTNVTQGANDRSNSTDPGLLGGIGDYTLYRFLGWSPWKPWEPIRVDDGVDAYTHAVIGDANTADAPAFDLYNENRPMWGTVDDRGGVEGRAYPVQDTASVMTGTNSMKFEGAGYQEWDVPVKAQSTTITVDAQFDSNYAGTLPQLVVKNIDGTADQTDTVTTAANTTDTLTITFTPDTAGWVQVRVVSNDTSATGEAFFDDLTVT